MLKLSLTGIAKKKVETPRSSITDIINSCTKVSQLKEDSHHQLILFSSTEMTVC